MTAKTERYVGIQVLRGVAALLVTLHHFCLTTVHYGDTAIPGIGFMAEWGQCGVDIFFCISGFVMLLAISSASNPLDFLTRRAIRIYPTYWAASALFALAILVIALAKTGAPNNPLFDWGYLFRSFLLWPSISPADGSEMPLLEQGWTLSYELLFYLLVAAFVRPLRSLGISVTCITVAFAVLNVFTGMLADPAARAFFSNPIYFEFILGAGVFLVARSWRGLGAPILFAGFVLLTFRAQPTARVIAWGVPAALILYGVVVLEGKFRYPKALVLLGDSSYSLYLTHGFLTYAYGAALKRGYFVGVAPKAVVIASGALAAVGFGIAFWAFVERPVTARLNALHRVTKTHHSALTS